GHFVDNISFGPAVVATVRNHTKLPLDVHLMIERPDHYLPRFLEAGANSITVHVESESRHEVPQTLAAIRAAGCGVGLSLNPATPRFDLVLAAQRSAWSVAPCIVHQALAPVSLRESVLLCVLVIPEPRLQNVRHAGVEDGSAAVAEHIHVERFHRDWEVPRRA